LAASKKHEGVIHLFLTQDSVCGEEEIALPELEKSTAYLLSQAEVAGDFSVGIKICGREEISLLHAQYMQDASATDVMAFSADQEASEDGYLGDVIICRDVAQEEGKKRGHSTVAEMQFYVLHGLLHLLGYNDTTDEGKNKMLDIQRKALSLRGIIVT